MRILYQRPAATSGMSERYQSIFSKIKDVEVEVRHFQPRGGKPSQIPYYIGDVILAASKAKEEGFDAMVIGCCGDPGLLEAKKQTKIPVTAPAEACMRIASTYGKFAVISPGVTTTPTSRGGGTWDLARIYGLDSYMVSHRGVNVVRPPDSDEIALRDPEKWRDIIWNMHREALEKFAPLEAKKAVEEDGAKAIFLACTFFTGWTKEIKSLEAKVGVPCLDPGITTVKYARTLAELRQ